MLTYKIKKQNKAQKMIKNGKKCKQTDNK